MKLWLTMAEAAALAQRNKRTIRRWRLQGLIKTTLDGDARTVLYSRADILRVEAEKTAYATRPTFGRTAP